MVAAAKHAFVIAGTRSGCAKTTVTLGLFRTFMQCGVRVPPFKITPLPVHFALRPGLLNPWLSFARNAL
ncbi:MAG TPA: hypothetical protein VJY99_14605 [Buttiauxella sp.]|uniref:nucleotide-binding protein n=1 Tax=Buttiauxella sp. TaxID=1972222 RepID=UPI002B45B9B0|nr:hypothetical protein [Buttiauxella sp.]HKM97906.1 hypothetical protein [Buttiauxella sp.]